MEHRREGKKKIRRAGSNRLHGAELCSPKRGTVRTRQRNSRGNSRLWRLFGVHSTRSTHWLELLPSTLQVQLRECCKKSPALAVCAALIKQFRLDRFPSTHCIHTHASTCQRLPPGLGGEGPKPGSELAGRTCAARRWARVGLGTRGRHWPGRREWKKGKQREDYLRLPRRRANPGLRGYRDPAR